MLREGGRLSLSVWGDPDRNPWASIPGRLLIDHTGAPPPQPDEPGIFGLADPERLTPLIRGAGFDEPKLEEVEVTYRFAGFDQYWRFINQLAGGLAVVLKALEEDDRAAIRARLEQEVAVFASNGFLELGGVVLNEYAK